MALSQPLATDKLSTPDHSLMHRIIATDPGSPVQVVRVDSSGDTSIGSATNYAKIAQSGELTFAGTGGITNEHGSFSSNATQTITGLATAAYPITYTDTEDSTGVTFSGSTITVSKRGTYLITTSIIVSTASNNREVSIWLLANGVNVPRSATTMSFAAAGRRCITVSWLYTFAAGENLELDWSSSINTTTLLATGVGTNPTRPASPSVITTVNKVSET